MTKEQIYASLDAMLANPKAKTFLNHLVRAYMPETNRTYIKVKPSGPIKCVLTGVSIISHQEVDELFEKNKDKMANLTGTHDEKFKAILNFVGDREEGCTGNQTTTYMSHLANMAFTDWVITKSLKGDKHINWLLGSIRRDSLMARAESITDKDVQTKVAAFKKHNAVVKGTTISLGETSDVLMKLKAAMEANNN